MTDADKSFVIRVLVSVLAASAFAVILALLIGLFSHRVDNAMIFKILEPLSNQVTGAIIAVFSMLATKSGKGK